MARPIINTNWTARTPPWDNCMAIIQTWLYDDSQIWEDLKIWWDNWSIWTSWWARPTITTNWN